MLDLLERVITDRTPHFIQTTNNSLEVPSILERQHFHVVITDLRMPGMNGMEILNWIKERDRREEVIIITAFGGPEWAKQALDAGAFDYLLKPFHREQLLFSLTRALLLRDLKLQVARFEQLFAETPYDQAVGRFRTEYVARLAENLNNDLGRVAQTSGLDEATVRQELAGIQKDDEPSGA
jgi:DNA-binding NtrC family response regulator